MNKEKKIIVSKKIFDYRVEYTTLKGDLQQVRIGAEAVNINANGDLIFELNSRILRAFPRGRWKNVEELC